MTEKTAAKPPADFSVGIEEIRQRATAQGLTIPEDRLEAFARSTGVMRRCLAPLHTAQAKFPRDSVFGGRNDQ